MGFSIKKVDGLEYICKAKRYAGLKKILARIVKDYKEIFLGRLQKDGSGVAAVSGSKGKSQGGS
ncbi:hypothetical protein LRB67_05585 [Borreliella bissettiae]|uniref:hypothetical protein n=1 Tax=Borrelia bissettiae TaxID=64897 RepID=UPI001E587924|nr:hypothetical protein [Borreliella bissettiae]MCD2401717.1 hypothetical protein [Borreliella bissettiae]